MNKAKSDYVSNLCKNALFPISAAAFYDLNDVPRNAVLLGAIAVIAIAAYFPDVYTGFRNASPKLRLVSILSSIGTSIACAHMSITTNINYFDWAFFLDSTTNTTLYYIYKIIMMVLAVFFIIVPMEWFYSHAYEFAREYYKKLERSEKICLTALWGIFSVYIIVSYLMSKAFYSGDMPWDYIYSFDSPAVFDERVYLWLGYMGTDIRHPLLAVFTAPFIGIPYLIMLPFLKTGVVMPIVFSVLQAGLLLVAFNMLGQMMHISANLRNAFVVFCSCTYSSFIYTLLIEKYIFSFFWLITFMYMALEKKEKSICAYTGMTGTFVLNGIMFPLLSDRHFIKEFKDWFREMFSAALKVLFIIILFGQIDCLINVPTSSKHLFSTFADVKGSFLYKLMQYLDMADNSFIAPHEVMIKNGDITAWWLKDPEIISVFGIIVIVLSVLGFIVSHKEKISKISFFYVIFSALVFIGVGLGSVENAMILYSLMFNWAFFVLVFRLIVFIGEKIKIASAVPYIILALSCGMLIVNICGISELISFAVTYYPAFG